MKASVLQSICSLIFCQNPKIEHFVLYFFFYYRPFNLTCWTVQMIEPSYITPSAHFGAALL